MSNKPPMTIKFTGKMVIPPEDIPDERGTVDVWLLNFIERTIKKGPELDDIYDTLDLSWEVEKNEQEV